MVQCEFCEDWFHPNCLNPPLNVDKEDQDKENWLLMCSNCVKSNHWIIDYVQTQGEETEIG